MRSFWPIIALIGCSFAAPAENLQLVIGHNEPLVQVSDKPSHETTRNAVIQTNQTIYTYLSQQLRYTKLVRLIDFDEKYVTILNATTDSITFFAPDNKALTPPKKGGRRHDSPLSLARLYEEYEKIQLSRDDDDDDEEKKKRFKKILHALLKYHTLPSALSKPELYTNATYGTALEAKDGSFDGQPRRISVVNDFFHLYANFYAKFEWVSVSAVNGYIYGINHPLFPFPSILDELFLVDQFSTLTSSLQKVGLEDQLQWRLKASSETQGDGPVVSLFAPTNKAWQRLPSRLRLYLFSPAGEKALKKLLQFHIVPNYILHSDWFHNATSDEDLTAARTELKKECGCHDWYRDIKSIGWPNSGRPIVLRPKPSFKDKMISIIKAKLSMRAVLNEDAVPHCRIRNFRAAQYMEHVWPHDPPNVTVNTTVPTLLEGHDLRFAVIKPKTHGHSLASPLDSDSPGDPVSHSLPPLFRSVVLANGVPGEVESVARNGALYSLGHVINPFKESSANLIGEGNGWKNWEDWLPAWGEIE